MACNDCYFSRDHFWVLEVEEILRAGISEQAQNSLGDIVFVDLPKPGMSVRSGQVIGIVESVKSTSDLISPVTGKILNINEAVLDMPELINSSPYGEGWLLEFVGEMDPELMSEDDYLSSL